MVQRRRGPKIPSRLAQELNSDHPRPERKPGKDRKGPRSSKKSSNKRRLDAYDIADESQGDTSGSENEGAAPDAEGDDEEIDSDEAFESEDDERFSSWKFRGSRPAPADKGNTAGRKQKSVSFDVSDKESDPDADSSDASEGSEDDGMIDLSEVLDQSPPSNDSYGSVDFEDEENNEVEHGASRLPAAPSSSLASSTDPSTSEGLLSQSETGSDDSEAIAEGGNQYGNDYEDLSSSSYSGSESEVDEDEDSGDASSGTEADDAVNGLTDFVNKLDNKRKSDQTENAPSKKHRADAASAEIVPADSMGSAERLRIEDMMEALDENARTKGALKHLSSKSKKGPDVLPAPLAKPIQDKLDREAAYDASKEQVGKWQDTVRRNRAAKHLQFPMNVKPETTLNSNSLAATHQPSNQLESKIDGLLTQSGMKNEKGVDQAEELAMNRLTPEEVQARRRELRMMRELMFRHDMKAKRIAKIKSKSYRKIRRKEKDRLGRLAPQELDNEDPQAQEEARMKMEVARAKERMTQRHKNTGKWAQRQLQRGLNDEGSREAITEQLRRAEQLQSHITGHGDEEASEDCEDIEQDNEALLQEIARLEQKEPESEGQGKGLAQMKFMQQGREARDNRNQQDLAALKATLQSNGETDLTKPESSLENPGRRSFAPNKQDNRSSQNRDKNSDQPETQENPFSFVKSYRERPAETTSASQEPGANEVPVNPWLSGSNQRAETSFKREKGEAGKLAEKLTKERKAVGQSQSPSVQIDVSSSSLRREGSDSDDEEQKMAYNKGKLALKQMDLVREAFAGEDVARDFEREKASEIEQDAPKEEDVTLPGWGSWTGSGISKKKQQQQAKRFIKSVPGLDPSKRKDFKLDNVIMNEKRLKKAKPFLATDVPFPYETREQYERAMALPVGEEWNSRNMYQNLTKPRVMVKRGLVIDPLKAPFK